MSEREKKLQEMAQRVNSDKKELKRAWAELEEREKRLQEGQRIEVAKQLMELATAGNGQRPVANTVVRGTIGSISEYSLDDDWIM